jgi:hypothetical protein
MNDMKQVRMRIVALVEHHDPGKCPGCPTCDEIKLLRTQMVRDPKPHKHILAKGQNMTKSDIGFLLEHGVKKRDLQKALHMGSNDFLKTMQDLGFSKAHKKEESTMAFEMGVKEFVDLRFVNIFSYVKIAKIKGVSDATIHMWKDKHKDEIATEMERLNINQPEKKAQVVTVKNDIAAAPTPEPKLNLEKLKGDYEKEIADVTEIYENKIEELKKMLANEKGRTDVNNHLIKKLQAELKAYEQNHYVQADVDNELIGLRTEIRLVRDLLRFYV